jgi:hypothetical protein
MFRFAVCGQLYRQISTLPFPRHNLSGSAAAATLDLHMISILVSILHSDSDDFSKKIVSSKQEAQQSETFD